MQKGVRDSDAPLLEYLFAGSPPLDEEIRRRYVIYSSHLENLLKPTEPGPGAEKDLHASADVRVQVFPFGDTGYSEETALLRITKTGVWDTLEFELPQGLGNGPLRIDPSHEPSLVQIREVFLFADPSGEVVWSIDESSRDQLEVDGTATLLPCDDGVLLSSFGDDPQLVLRIPSHGSGSLKLRLQLRVLPTPLPAPGIIAGLISQSSEAAKKENDRLADELRRSNAEKDQASAKHAAVVELLNDSRTRLSNEQTKRDAMEHSLSWRITAPIRRIMMSLRSGRRREQ